MSRGCVTGEPSIIGARFSCLVRLRGFCPDFVEPVNPLRHLSRVKMVSLNSNRVSEFFEYFRNFNEFPVHENADRLTPISIAKCLQFSRAISIECKRERNLYFPRSSPAPSRSPVVRLHDITLVNDHSFRQAVRFG